MAVLVYAKHDNATLNDATAKAVTAASGLGGEIHVLVAGEGAEGLGQAGAQTALGEGVFEKIVGGGGMGKIRVAQEV